MDGDWDTPQQAESPFGNRDITETNVVTIQQLKQKYNKEISYEGSYQLIDEDLQIKGYVTGNDITGNFYNEVSLQDETGAIFIGITRGGLCGVMPLGSEVLVSLKGLYIGNYRLSATIGTPYKDSNGTWNVSRMPFTLWASHFKLTGQTRQVEPELFADGNATTTWNLKNDAGKLGILRNVTIKQGGYYNSDTKSYVDGVQFVPGTSTYSHPDYSTSWYFNEQPTGQNGGVQIYNSSYADFAAQPLPTGKVNITGVVKRYRNQWEFIIRSVDDVTPAQ